MLKTYTCTYCNKQFDRASWKVNPANTRIYCCREHHDAYKREIWNKITIQCATCGKEMMTRAGRISARQKKGQVFYCSPECTSKGLRTTDNLTLFNTTCSNCNKAIQKTGYDMDKSNIHFCCRKCQGSYFARKGISVNNRSLLEQKLEVYIRRDFPHLKLITSDRTVCDPYELDFYCPDIKLAIEINGPAHYKPIFGKRSLEILQERDKLKLDTCQQRGIQLSVVTDLLNHVNDNSEEIYNNKIKSFINEHTKINC